MSVLVHLRQFEGPLGLLLYLIKKEEMDIFDIRINEITKQYLDYIQTMRELDLENAGEFVAMAATLIQIKSRMLLPQYDENGEEVITDDPRKELVQRLLEYQKFQEAAQKLQERPWMNRDTWVRGTCEEVPVDDDLVEVEDNGLFSLISAYRGLIRTMEKSIHTVKAKVQSIGSRVMEIRAKLVVGVKLKMAELLSTDEPVHRRQQLLITFLAMLELGKMGFVRLFQSEAYGDIYIEAQKPIETDVMSRVEEYDAANAEAVVSQLLAAAEDDSGDLADSNAEVASDEEINKAAEEEQELVHDERSIG